MRSGEERELYSTALLRRGFISADFWPIKSRCSDFSLKIAITQRVLVIK
jgi:hypothetical protein